MLNHACRVDCPNESVAPPASESVCQPTSSSISTAAEEELASARIYPPVRSLLRGLEVLTVVNERRCAQLPDIVRRVGLPRPTVIRLLESLEGAGYITRHAATGTYEPALKVTCLAAGFNVDSWLLTVTTPILRRLIRKIGWPSDLMFLQGSRITVRNSSRTMTALKIDRRFKGVEAALSTSAGGRAHLAYSSDAERSRLLELISNVTERESVMAEIKRTRERGYALRDPGARPQMGAIAIPVMANNTLECTMNCVYLPNVATAEEIARNCLPAMRGAAEDIGKVFESRRSRL